MKLTSIAALLLAPLALSCGTDDQDPEGATSLLASIRSQEYATKFFRPAGWETKKASTAPHGGEVEIFVNNDVRTILEEQIKVAAYPEGSIIVKQGYEEGELTTIAAMIKRTDGWFWAEWDAATGESIASGAPDLCTECHADGGSDFVRSFKLPQ